LAYFSAFPCCLHFGITVACGSHPRHLFNLPVKVFSLQLSVVDYVPMLTRLGTYEIEGLLGVGGMGEVYAARDKKLGRSVALKVLPEALERDPERVSRFEREAKVLASLNHANIATLHGIEEAEGKHFLIMELVEGETLAQRIKRGPIPVEEALRIARQIAEALEAAHEKGIVHRDLKPSNVKVTPEERVKVLDFGLAKAMQSAPANAAVSNSPTLTMAATQAGIILGTAAYMSPEQAKGLEADHRSDVFSFGCVLYEMLTARQAFSGDTVSEILAAVLVKEPDFSLLPAKLNPRISEILRRCLAKTPRLRWQATGDLRAEIEAVAASPRAAPEQAPNPPATPLWRRASLLGTAIVLTIAAGFIGWSLRKPAPEPVIRFPLVLPEDQRLLTVNASHAVTISPDGRRLVYLANGQIFIRSMDETEAQPLVGKLTTEAGQAIAEPFFSPDGQWIGFYSREDTTLKKISVNGGAALTLCKTDSVSGAFWEGDYIWFARLRDKGIMRVAATSGEPEEMIARGPSESFHGPQLLDNGRWVLFTVTTEQGDDRWEKAQIVVQSLDSKERKVLIRGGSDARYLPTGHLVYALRGTLFAVPLDIGKMEVVGSPTPVLEGVRRANPINTAAAHFALSTAGSLIYLPGTPSSDVPQRTLALLDRTGKAQRLSLPVQNYLHPRISPDGGQLAYGTDDGREANVWIMDLQGTAQPRRLTFGGRNFNPIWSHDSRSITFQSNREGDWGLFHQQADGSGTAKRLTKAEQAIPHVPQAWSPDGKTLVYRLAATGISASGVLSLSPEGDNKSTPLFPSMGFTTQGNVTFSWDGKWLAYSSNEPDAYTYHNFVQPFPPTGAKYQYPEVGVAPLWSRDGRELFYVMPRDNRLVTVKVNTVPSFSFGESTSILVPGLAGNSGTNRNYDLTGDGQHWIAVMDASNPLSTTSRQAEQINVVLNWFEELNRRVPIN
jgi:eukaryotic-like serine/threonine-protein kinase